MTTFIEDMWTTWVYKSVVCLTATNVMTNTQQASLDNKQNMHYLFFYFENQELGAKIQSYSSPVRIDYIQLSTTLLLVYSLLFNKCSNTLARNKHFSFWCFSSQYLRSLDEFDAAKYLFKPTYTLWQFELLLRICHTMVSFSSFFNLEFWHSIKQNSNS